MNGRQEKGTPAPRMRMGHGGPMAGGAPPPKAKDLGK
jgi:hypothetical protein